MTTIELACPRICRCISKIEHDKSSIYGPGQKLIVYTLPSIWHYRLFQNSINISVNRVLGRPGPGPDRLGLNCYLAWGGNQGGGWGGKGSCRFHRQVIWNHTGPSTRISFEKTHVFFTAKSFGNTLGLATGVLLGIHGECNYLLSGRLPTVRQIYLLSGMPPTAP